MRQAARLLLEKNKTSSSLKVLIGEETRRPELADSSLIIAQYAINGQDAGAIGIIGSTRMNYSKVIANIEYLSSSVGRILTELMKEE